MILILVCAKPMVLLTRAEPESFLAAHTPLFSVDSGYFHSGMKKPLLPAVLECPCKKDFPKSFPLKKSRAGGEFSK